jgi:hypothetical protein
MNGARVSFGVTLHSSTAALFFAVSREAMMTVS